MESMSGKSNQQDLVSHHIFLLPFKWQREDGAPYNVEHFAALTEKLLEMPEWDRRYFNIDNVVQYNEFHYFYDYVTEVLYETNRHATPQESFIAHYEYSIAPGIGRYLITTPDPHQEGEKKTYELEIDSILLHLYYTGVGVLSFHLNNREPRQAAPEDIIFINQYGRRVFPPFYFIPPQKVGFQSQFEEKDFVNNLPSGTEIAHEIGIHLSEGKKENVHLSENWKRSLKDRLKDNEKFKFKLPAFLQPFLEDIEEGYDIYPILDDRMFVACWYGNNELSEAFKTALPEEAQHYSQNDWWYRYTFVDGKYATVKDADLHRQLVQKATYTRWKNSGTLYGITEYSLVLLTEDLPTLRAGYAAYLVTHLQSIYYRLAELVLVQRASIQRFSDDITHISKLDGSDVEQAKLASLLSQRYIRFVNRIYFREVTAQAQGIEIYDKLQEQARVAQHVEALQQEIERLQVYIRQETDRHLLAAEKERESRQKEADRRRLEDEKKREEEAKEKEKLEKARWDKLTLLGALLVAPSLLLAAHGLSFVPACFSDLGGWSYVITVLAAAGSAGLSFWAFQKSRTQIWIISIVLYLILLLIPNLICLFRTADLRAPDENSISVPADTLSPPIIKDSISINDTINTLE